MSNMLKKWVDKFSNKNKVIVSMLGLFSVIFGGSVIALLLQNFWSFVVILVMIGQIGFLFDAYDVSKKNYFYEISNKYFEENKDGMNKDKELNKVRSLSRIKDFCTTLQVVTLPVEILLFMLFVVLGLSFPIALTVCGYIFLATFLITLPTIEYSDFCIDVLCEVVGKFETYKCECSEVSQKEFPNKIFTINTGNSEYRCRYVQPTLCGGNISRDDFSVINNSLYEYGFLSPKRRSKRKRLIRSKFDE